MVGGAVKNFFKKAKVFDKFKPFDSIEEVGKAKFIFICVPTPATKDGLDLSITDDAVANATRHLADPANQLIVIKSTLLPGTTENYQKRYKETNFVFNPEFLRDKSAAPDFENSFTDRQIIGYTSKTKDHPLVSALMKLLPPAAFQKIIPAEAAEMIKYAGNTFLAMKVIFANQIYDLCEALKIDYEDVKEAIKSDKRIGKSHWEIRHTESSLDSTRLEKYRGYGGKCFPKDVNSLIVWGKSLGVDMSLLEQGREINSRLNGGKYDQ